MFLQWISFGWNFPFFTTRMGKAYNTYHIIDLLLWSYGKDNLNKKFWKELVCLLSFHYLKMSFAFKSAFAPT
jgi:hypothetical protein